MSQTPFAIIRRCLYGCMLAVAFSFTSPAIPYFIPTIHASEVDKDFSGDASAGEDEDSGEDALPEFDTDWSMEEDFSMADESPDLTWRVTAGFHNLINTREELHFQDAYQKNEITARLDLKYGTARSYLKSITDLYFLPTFINDDIGDHYPYAEESEVARNLRISSRESEVIFRELYYNYPFEKARIRVGNQLFAWGTADFLNSTAYLNPQDLREIVFKDQDRVKLGVPAVSGLYFFDGYTLELVWVPVHTAPLLPPDDHFWSVKQVENQFPVYFDDTEPMDANSENFGYAARMASSYRGMDFSFSGYHGPDREPVLRPHRTVLVPNETIGVAVRPYFDVVDYIGFDFSTSQGDFVFQVEGAYSPNKSGFIEQDTSDPASLEFPFEVDQSHYFSYSLGFNYFIPMHKLIPGHAGDTLYTMEWYQARYTDNDINPPLITDLLTARFQDDYFGKRVHLSLTGIFETRNGGVILWPEVEYDFKNGFKLKVGYAAINGQGEGDFDEDSLLFYYRKNDFIMVNLTYDYPS